MVPSRTKLIQHRWDMHALQALAKRDPDELTRIFTKMKELTEKAVDTQVKTFGFGAPMQFHTFGQLVSPPPCPGLHFAKSDSRALSVMLGFFDKTSEAHSSNSKALFERAVDGDTLLLLALRHHDPHCAIALVRLGASLRIMNSVGDSALQAAFDAMAFLRLHPDESQQQEQSNGNSSGDEQYLKLRVEYETLFGILHNELKAFHEEKVAMTERALIEIYQQFAPDRVSKIPSQLEAFVYREHLLLEGVREKYLS